MAWRFHFPIRNYDFKQFNDKSHLAVVTLLKERNYSMQ